jgi:quercetin dioxygenase-like cupin family protein
MGAAPRLPAAKEVPMIFPGSEAKETRVDESVLRRLLGHGEGLMMAEVRFKKGGIGSPHAHEAHEQISYIVSGSFEVSAGKDKAVLKAGDAFHASRGETHGVLALEDSVILDIFTPIRQDFL